MLHEFVTSNRDELIRRCRSKVSRRDSPPVTVDELHTFNRLLVGNLGLRGLRGRSSKSA